MRTSRPVAIALAAASICVAGLTLVAMPAGAANAAVTATETNRWSPASVTIDIGNSVTWTNPTLNTHNVTSSGGPWSKNTDLGPAIPAATSTSFTFTRAGTYGYFCRFHRAEGMIGTVVVRARPTPRPTPSRTTEQPRPSPTRTRATPPPRSSPDASPPPSPPASPPRTSPPTPPPATVTTPTPSDEASIVDLGSGGLTPHPATGRERGIWVALAAVALGGVLTAQLRAVLSVSDDEAEAT